MQRVYEMAVTYEYETRAPETHRSEVEAGNDGKAVRLAMQAARRVLRPVGWTSFVCVCLSQRGAARRAIQPEVVARLASARAAAQLIRKTGKTGGMGHDDRGSGG
jgi:hypothetical protein